MATHAARLSKSKRLQEVLNVLKDGCWHSSREISRKTGSVAVHLCFVRGDPLL